MPSRAQRITIRSRAEFKEAQQAFRQGDKAKARRLLEALRLDTRLSATDQAFLQRQVLLCQPPAAKDCGPRALLLVLRALGVSSDLKTVTALCGTGTEGTQLSGLKRAAESLGVEATGVQLNQAALRKLSSPAVAWWEGDHFVAVLRVGLDAQVHDPRNQAPRVLPVSEVLAKSGGVFLVIRRK